VGNVVRKGGNRKCTWIGASERRSSSVGWVTCSFIACSNESKISVLTRCECSANTYPTNRK
jgi:hypothetical protein